MRDALCVRIDEGLRYWTRTRTEVGTSPVDLGASVQMRLPRPERLNVDWSRTATPPRREEEVFRGGLVAAFIRICAWTYAAFCFYLGNFGDGLLRRNTEQRRAERLGRIVQKSGPTAIKIAQQASMRIDLLPYAYAFELSRLLDDCPPFPVEQAIRIIEDATGKPLAANFAAFDRVPVGSGSLACVYHAALHDGEEVAIKVRRPGVGDAIATDLRALKLLLFFLEFLFVIPPGFSKNFVQEMGSMLLEELNFAREARNMELYDRELRKAHIDYARTPRVHFNLSSGIVLVQEYVSGIWLSDILGAIERRDYAALATLRRREMDPKLIARRLLLVARFGGFESLLFHADLHPANVLVQDGNQLVFIDLGSCGNFTKHEREVWRKFLSAQHNNDVGRMVKAALALIEPLPPFDIDEFTRRLESLFFQDMCATKSKHALWWERTSANIWISFLRLSREYEIPMQLNTLRMIRVTMLADTIAVRLDSSLDIYHEYRRYEKGAGKRAKKKIRKRIRQLLSAHTFIRWEQALDTGEDLVFDVQRLASTSTILKILQAPGKLSWAVDLLIKVLSFFFAVEVAASTAVWLVRNVRDLSSQQWVLWLQGGAAYAPKDYSFSQVLRAVLTTPWSQIFIVGTVVWTLIRLHKRLEDAEIEHRDSAFGRR